MSYSLEQLAAAMRLSHEGIRRRAYRESWAFTSAPCRGGYRHLYDAADLPSDVRLALEQHQIRQIMTAELARRAAEQAAQSLPSPALTTSGEGAGLSTPTASSGQSIPAGLPSPADSSPAATGAGGLAGADGRRSVRLVGTADAHRPRDAADAARAARAQRIQRALAPLLALPARHPGRRAMAESIAGDLGVSWQQVYKYADRLRDGGLAALLRLGARSDRGAQRHLVSAEWEAWCTTALAEWPAADDAASLSDRLRQSVRSAWVGGAPSARQCWLKATAAMGRALYESGCPQPLIARMLQLPCPRRWVEVEGQVFRVAGKALRDGKGVYDHNLTPVRRTAAGYGPGDLVCGDVSPLDIPVLRPDGSTAYARMICWHDVGTNWLWIDLYLTDKGEGVRREQVAASFARMCETAPFGAPKRLYLDNGSEYQWDDMIAAWGHLAMLTGQQFGLDDARSMPDAGRLIRSIPFRPRGKRIEGQFGNLRHWLGWWLGYVGGNRMTKRVANLGKAPTPSDFYAVRDWLKAELDDYHVTPQPGAEHMAGLSPQGKLERAMNAGWAPARIDRVALMLSFAERDSRVVTRGAIQYAGRTWVNDELMTYEGRVTVALPRIAAPEFEALAVFMPGRDVVWAVPERVFGLVDAEGAKEANRRNKTLKLLLADRVEQAGGAVDAAEVSGFRAKMLGLQATQQRALDIGAQVQPSPEMQALLTSHAALTEQTRALMRRAEAAKDAEQLRRMAFETEDEAAARAMGY
ncbi:MAG: hypothetical protein AB1412_05395 [Pseudomonadota bacterium]